MKAILINQFGKSCEFERTEVSVPSLKSGEVLIKVCATSVNPLDYKIRSGALPDLVPSFPMILHGDVAGVVTSIGEDVTIFKPGDEVYGCIGGLLNMPGALAEYVAADQKLISLKPKSLDMRAAAALPLVAETAWQALDRANLKANQTILVHGGTGGVGHIAVQLAKLRGAKVFATVSSQDNAKIALELGADITINYKDESVADYVNKYTNNRGFDVVIDTVGIDNLNKSIEAVAINGSVVTIMPYGEYNLDKLFLKNASLNCVFQPLPLITGQNRDYYNQILTKVAEHVDKSELKPLIDQQKFSFDDVGEAHDYLESGKATGKVVIG